MTLAVTRVQPELAAHVLASGVPVVPAVLSLSVAVAQSYVTVSGQLTLYQNVRVLLLEGAVRRLGDRG